MSHFTVLVTKTQENDVESQLERFNEQGEDNDYFMEKEIEVAAEDMEAEAEMAINQYKKYHKDAIKKRRIAKRTFKETDEWVTDKKLEEQLEHDAKYNNHYKEIIDKYEELYFDGKFLEIMQDYHGYEVDEDGNLYSICNSDAHWDWYTVGGRWTGYLKLKEGADGDIGTPGVFGNKAEAGHADIALVKDIDWDGMKADRLARAEKLWAEYQLKLSNNEKIQPYWDYGIEVGDTKESFIKRETSLATFAVLHNDEWHESGSMGWFGMASDKKETQEWEDIFDSILASLNPDDEIAIVDCHI